MRHIGARAESAAKRQIAANVVTYIPVLEGYGQEGRRDMAFELMDATKKSERCQPDEIAYNTPIHDCAQRGPTRLASGCSSSPPRMARLQHALPRGPCRAWREMRDFVASCLRTFLCGCGVSGRGEPGDPAGWRPS